MDEGLETAEDVSGRRRYWTAEQQRRIAPVLAATLGDMARRVAADGGAVAAAMAATDCWRRACL